MKENMGREERRGPYKGVNRKPGKELGLEQRDPLHALPHHAKVNGDSIPYISPAESALAPAGDTALPLPCIPRRCDADERAARHLPAAMIPAVA